ncbi:MAG: outer membrane protein transport protein [Deltaproteobacteria bacterium]|nr:outer membrane protein transport protein [Deltaproteobacteria bacterium]
MDSAAKGLTVDGARTADSRSSLHFPDIYTLGVAWWPLRDKEHEWKLETDVDYVRWSTIDKIEYAFSDGVTLSTPQSWGNAFTTGTGTEYTWLGLSRMPAWDIALRGGYNFSMTPVPDINFSPAFSDSDVHTLSTGAGMTRHSGSKFIGFDFAYQLLLFVPRTVSGNPNPAVDGKYNTINQAITLSSRIGF